MAKGYFLEALCILADLSNCMPIKMQDALHLFKKFGPVPMRQNGHEKYLWYQSTLDQTESGMEARPDILITNSPTIDKGTIIGFRECKCRPALSAGDIRKEFGKAFDLKAKSYVIVCYYRMPDKIKEAAGKLGLEIEELGLYSEDRDHFLSDKMDLGADLSEKLRKADEKGSFARLLLESADVIERKLLPQ